MFTLFRCAKLYAIRRYETSSLPFIRNDSNFMLLDCSFLALPILDHLAITSIYCWKKFSRGRRIIKLLSKRYISHLLMLINCYLRLLAKLSSYLSAMQGKQFLIVTYMIDLLRCSKVILCVAPSIINNMKNCYDKHEIPTEIISGGFGAIDGFTLEQLYFHVVLWFSY